MYLFIQTTQHVEEGGEGVGTLWLYLTNCRLCSGAVWPGPASQPHTAVQTKPEDLAAQLTRHAQVCQVSRRGDRSSASFLSVYLSAACDGLNLWALTLSNVWCCWALVCHMDDDGLAVKSPRFGTHMLWVHAFNKQDFWVPALDDEKPWYARCFKKKVNILSSIVTKTYKIHHHLVYSRVKLHERKCLGAKYLKSFKDKRVFPRSQSYRYETLSIDPFLQECSNEDDRGCSTNQHRNGRLVRHC